MRLRVTFEPVASQAALAGLRREYLQALPEAPAPLLRLMAKAGLPYRIRARDTPCGYLIVSGPDTLVEFHLQRSHWVFGEVVLQQARAALGLRRALVQQFDALLLSSAIAHQERVRSLGLLTRDFVPRALPPMPRGVRFVERAATRADLPAMQRVDQQVFAEPARLCALIDAGGVQLFERDGMLIGFGLLRPVGPDAVELGIAVDRPYRARGYAVYLLRALIDRCVAEGKRPIAGSAEDNHASRNMGERVGLVARYRLLELSFPATQSAPAPPPPACSVGT